MQIQMLAYLAICCFAGKLWGFYANDNSNTYCDITPAVTFTHLFIALSLDYEPVVATSLNKNITFAVWNSQFTSNSTIRFLLQDPKSYPDNLNYLAIAR